MATLLFLVTSFGYFIAALMAGATVAYCYQDQIVGFLDSTIPWPGDDPATLYGTRAKVFEARCQTCFAQHRTLAALASPPCHLPVREMPPPRLIPHGSLAIIPSHPDGHAS